LEIIPLLEEKFDLVFIDGDKREYCDYYRLSIDKVNSGGFIIADNTLWSGKILEPDATDQQTKGIIEFNEMLMHEQNIEHIIIPLRDGLTIIRKK
jgi:predicted O-methyltransferase YrrM